MCEIKRILIVNGSSADIGLIQSALEEQDLEKDTVVVQTGENALEYLFRRGKFAAIPQGLPELVLLDLYLPFKSGLSVLQEIRSDKQFNTIPVVIITDSLNQNDKENCLSHGANEFISKPMDYKQFCESLKEVTDIYIFKCQEK